MSVEIIYTIAQLRRQIAKLRHESRSIGCVPTMGALHAGHGALIERARSLSDIVVVTIFVNPLQFDRSDDYERYARTFEADCRLCAGLGVDIVFAPSAEEMYPELMATYVEAPEIVQHLCGEFRPGHFRGVATVVTKLFNIVQPDAAYFGEKDAQQLALIQRMTRDLNFAIEIVPVPTVREPDGLAMSSRNERLAAEERKAAPILFQALTEGKRLILSGERQAAKIKQASLAVIAREPLVKVEYFEAVDGRMQPVEQIRGDVRLAVAAWLGSTRLIDNVLCRTV